MRHLSIALVCAMLSSALACGGAAPQGGTPGTAELTSSAPGGEHGWRQVPSSIAGKWRTEAYPADMIVEITVTGHKAVGKIVSLGGGGKRHYTLGEEVLNLEADEFGHWGGQLHEKWLSGLDRMDPIDVVSDTSGLRAVSADPAFKHLTRVE